MVIYQTSLIFKLILYVLYATCLICNESWSNWHIANWSGLLLFESGWNINGYKYKNLIQHNANISKTNLSGANLRGASLAGTDLTVAYLKIADLSYENMNSLLNDIRVLVEDIKENPTKYMKAYRKSKK